MTYPHASTVCLGAKLAAAASRLAPGALEAGPRPEPAHQLAWLTEDILKASTRTGGIAARLK
jgi:hypothetical protein